MASDDDNFDIDIYGDGGVDYQEEGQVHDQDSHSVNGTNMQDSSTNQVQEHSQPEPDPPQVEASIPDTSLPKPPQPVLQQTQGTTRKDGSDERHVDPGATPALFVGELNWWTTDDEVRGWAKEAGCEDELKEVTFNEQKVNGKSKGQAYLLFKTPQGATATKSSIDTLMDRDPKIKTKFSVSYTNPLQNPFKTLPKDGPMRHNHRNNAGNFNEAGGHRGGYNPNYRGRGRGFNAGNSSFNPRGGFQGGGGGGFQGNNMGGGFQGGQMSMPGMQSYGGGGGGYRGGMMGGRGGNINMRGGRGGIDPGVMGGMPNMGAMMPAMGMGMPMGAGMNAGMGMPAVGFQGAYNPGFYAQPGGDAGGWNAGPNKRPRQE